MILMCSQIWTPLRFCPRLLVTWAGVATTAGMDMFFTYVLLFNRYFLSVLCARWDSDQTHAEM